LHALPGKPQALKQAVDTQRGKSPAQLCTTKSLFQCWATKAPKIDSAAGIKKAGRSLLVLGDGG